MKIKDIQQLAEAHGLILTDKMKFNEMGIDFKVAFSTDKDGNQWLLRIPRRANLGEQIAQEKRILDLVGNYLTAQVPDWQIATNELVAYPLLDGKPALTYDSNTYEVSWNMARESPQYVSSLAKVLVQLHGIPEDRIVENRLKVMTPDCIRSEISERLNIVKSELGISIELERRYKKWLDKDLLWPNFTRFIHGDLYAGHVLTTKEGDVTGIIDWSTAHVSDTALDFSGHGAVFGEESLKVLISEYQKLGGQIWDKLFEQALERAAASPLAYGFFAIETQVEKHICAAKTQLGVD